MDRITIGVTAFQRPLHLKRCLQSIYDVFPNVKIIVGDTGDRYVDGFNCQYLKLPFDAGVSYSRNAIINEVKTPYFLLMEDDFIMDERCDIYAMLQILESHPDIGVVGGIHECSYRGKRAGHLYAVDGPHLKRIHTPIQATESGITFHVSDFVSNFALFRTCIFNDVKWDERLKTGEHVDFHRRLRDSRKWVVAYTESSQIGHDRTNRDNEYLIYRSRGDYYRDLAFNDYNGPNCTLPIERSICIMPLTDNNRLSHILHRLGVHMGYQFIDDNFNDIAFDELFSEHEIDSFKFNRLVSIRNSLLPFWGFYNEKVFPHFHKLLNAPWCNVKIINDVNCESSKILELTRGRYWPTLNVDLTTFHDRPFKIINEIIEFIDIDCSINLDSIISEII